MSDQPVTTAVDNTTTEQHWSPAPAVTLLAVILVWYLGVAALLVGQLV